MGEIANTSEKKKLFYILGAFLLFLVALIAIGIYIPDDDDTIVVTGEGAAQAAKKKKDGKEKKKKQDLKMPTVDIFQLGGWGAAMSGSNEFLRTPIPPTKVDNLDKHIGVLANVSCKDLTKALIRPVLEGYAIRYMLLQQDYETKLASLNITVSGITEDKPAKNRENAKKIVTWLLTKHSPDNIDLITNLLIKTHNRLVKHNLPTETPTDPALKDAHIKKVKRHELNKNIFDLMSNLLFLLATTPYSATHLGIVAVGAKTLTTCLNDFDRMLGSIYIEDDNIGYVAVGAPKPAPLTPKKMLKLVTLRKSILPANLLQEEQGLCTMTILFLQIVYTITGTIEPCYTNVVEYIRKSTVANLGVFKGKPTDNYPYFKFFFEIPAFFFSPDTNNGYTAYIHKCISNLTGYRWKDQPKPYTVQEQLATSLKKITWLAKVLDAGVGLLLFETHILLSQQIDREAIEGAGRCFMRQCELQLTSTPSYISIPNTMIAMLSFDSDMFRGIDGNKTGSKVIYAHRRPNNNQGKLLTAVPTKTDSKAFVEALTAHQNTFLRVRQGLDGATPGS
ncbi:hypothetical protein NEDG_00296 [Nematocida displodere]|uniref:Uncharacterized protein n=1 Tax=Nematocida displodere TaxID=1805483 RepID=A0A177EK34_9MICR|nr:hypothetical protein NEDG_00296 [Nematocida displodere]